jgi:hypothetical protein
VPERQLRPLALADDLNESGRHKTFEVVALTVMAVFRAQQGKASGADAISLAIPYRRGFASAFAMAANCHSGSRDGLPTRSLLCGRLGGAEALVIQKIWRIRAVLAVLGRGDHRSAYHPKRPGSPADGRSALEKQ